MWFSEISVLCGLAQDVPLVVQLCRLGSYYAAWKHIPRAIESCMVGIGLLCDLL
jgi:hypothetical protein